MPVNYQLSTSGSFSSGTPIETCMCTSFQSPSSWRRTEVVRVGNRVPSGRTHVGSSTAQPTGP
jgi:hypothetical protein